MVFRKVTCVAACLVVAVGVLGASSSQRPSIETGRKMQGNGQSATQICPPGYKDITHGNASWCWFGPAGCPGIDPWYTVDCTHCACVSLAEYETLQSPGLATTTALDVGLIWNSQPIDLWGVGTSTTSIAQSLNDLDWGKVSLYAIIGACIVLLMCGIGWAILCYIVAYPRRPKMSRVKPVDVGADGFKITGSVEQPPPPPLQPSPPMPTSGEHENRLEPPRDVEEGSLNTMQCQQPPPLASPRRPSFGTRPHPARQEQPESQERHIAELCKSAQTLIGILEHDCFAKKLRGHASNGLQ